MSQDKILYVIPCPIADDDSNLTLAAQTIQVIHKTHHFVAERAKTARRFIKTTIPPYALQEIEVEELDKHSGYALPEAFFEWVSSGKQIGLLSEAGCPCIADPGFNVIREARKYKYRIIPLVGPSSIFLALMASGLNGQQFTFHGYLSNDAGKLKNQVRQLEEQAIRKNYSQLFIETPYRNEKLLQSLLKLLHASTLLHISVNLTADNQTSLTYSVKEWKSRSKGLQLHKSPAVFIIGRESNT